MKVFKLLSGRRLSTLSNATAEQFRSRTLDMVILVDYWYLTTIRQIRLSPLCGVGDGIGRHFLHVLQKSQGRRRFFEVRLMNGIRKGKPKLKQRWTHQNPPNSKLRSL